MTSTSPFRPAALQHYLDRIHETVLPKIAPPQSLLDRLFSRRVPVLLQMSMVECGAACLAMVLSYHRRSTTVAEVRDRLGIGRDGTTARAIAQLARDYGLRTRAFSLEPDQMADLSLPAVVHWQFNHFLVLERWSPGKIEVVDPAIGRRTLTAEEFDAGFTGVVLTFEPGPHFLAGAGSAAAVPHRMAWSRYLRGVLPIPRVPAALVKILSASILLQLLGLSLPLLTALMIDRMLPSGSADLLPVIGGGILLLLGVQAVLSFGRASVLTRLQATLDARLMLDFFEHLLSLPFSFFQQRSTGDLFMRLNSNTVVRELLSGQLISVFLDAGLVSIYLGVLLWRDPPTAALVLAVGLIQAVLLLSGRKRMRAFMQRDLAAQSESQSYLVEVLKGVATLKVAGAEPQALERWSNLFYRYLNVSLERGRLAVQLDTVLGALRTFSPLALLWLGSARVLNGSLSLGEMLGLNALALGFLSPFSSLIASGWQFQLAGTHLERIADVVETAPEVTAASGRGQIDLQGGIELEDVSFRYSPDAPLILQGINLKVAPGQKVAIVGRSGSGKSTLAALMLGFHTPQGGRILYDGVPLSDLDLRAVRRQFGVVLQHTFVFSGSLRENLSLHEDNTPLEQIETAVRLAALDEDIARLPMGYETLLAEGGAGLSGGQLQRLALARALIHQPAVLLLDEATSSLDTVTERIVEENLRTIRSTRVVIAHRLSTICNADLIVVLDGGRIVEQGTHSELVALGGHYAALARSI